MRACTGWVLSACLLAACSSTPDTNPDVVAAMVKDGQKPTKRQPDLTVETIKTKLPEEEAEYRIGPNDVLNISVMGHPEFLGASKTAQGDLVGTRVQRDGFVYLPQLPGIRAAGRTVPEVRDALQEALKRFIKEPQAGVDILQYNSQKFFVLGQVGRPGVFPVDGNTTLLEGVARAGGIVDTGDIDGAYVIRGGKLLPVSLGDILLRGDTTRNVYMRNGDLVYVPDKQEWKVYVLGEVKRPGIVPMGRRGLNLAEALAGAEGIDPLYANRKVIRIFRGGWQKPKAYTLSTEDVYQYGTSIRLRPGDRIIVAPRPLATYARTISLLTPWLNSGSTAAAVAAAIAAN